MVDYLGLINSVVMGVAGWLITLGMLVGIGYIFYKYVLKRFTGYPVDVTIFEKRGSNFIITKDRGARLTTQEGKVVYKLQKKKIETRPTKYASTYISGKGKNFLYLYSPSIDEFDVIEITGDDTKHVKVIDEDMRFWLSEKYRKAYERWQTKSVWEKYASYIMLVVAMIGVMLVLYVTYQGMADMAAANQAIASTNAQVADKINEALRTLSGMARDTVTTASPQW